MLPAIDILPDENSHSIIQPGTPVYSIPLPLEGSLMMEAQMTRSSGYSGLYKGYWTRRGGESLSVAIKRIRRVPLDVEEEEEVQLRFEKVYFPHTSRLSSLLC